VSPEVLVLTPAARDADDPTGWKAIDRLIGAANGAPSNVSEKHDDVLYGEPHEALTVDADFTHRFVALPGPLPK
jgi:hypothetical protein